MSSWLGYDSSRKGFTGGPIRKKPPDPSIGAHLPPPPPGSKAARAMAERGGVAAPPPKKVVIKESSEERQKVEVAKAPAPTPAKGKNEPLPTFPPMPSSGADGLRSARLLPTANPLGAGLLPPRVEVQPLELTQVFGKRPRVEPAAVGSSRGLLVETVLNEREGVTAPPDPELVRCADNVAAQPDAVDTFLRKFAGGGSGWISPRSYGGGPSTTLPPPSYGGYAALPEGMPLTQLSPSRAPLQMQPLTLVSAPPAGAMLPLGASNKHGELVGNEVAGSPRITTQPGEGLLAADATFVLPSEYRDSIIATTKKEGGTSSARQKPSHRL